MGVVEGERIVSVVDVKDTVRSGDDVEHEDVVHAEEEVSETRVSASGLECEWVVDCEIPAEGSAGVGVGCRTQLKELGEEEEGGENGDDHGCLLQRRRRR